MSHIQKRQKIANYMMKNFKLWPWCPDTDAGTKWHDRCMMAALGIFWLHLRGADKSSDFFMPMIDTHNQMVAWDKNIIGLHYNSSSIKQILPLLNRKPFMCRLQYEVSRVQIWSTLHQLNHHTTIFVSSVCALLFTSHYSFVAEKWICFKRQHALWKEIHGTGLK